ncbi:MAG: mechanosensitive ion channel domain-containing protein [Candidatus Odinarchaeota archaeon]
MTDNHQKKSTQEDKEVKEVLVTTIKSRIFIGTIELISILLIITGGLTHLAIGLGWLTELENLVNDQFGEATFAKAVHVLDVYVFTLAIFILVTLIVLRIWKRIIKSTGAPPTIVGTLYTIGRMIIFSFAAVAYINSFSDFSGVLVSFGAVFGASLGFASSNSISNLISGLYLLATRPFVIGDYIILPEGEGVVLEVTINYTRIKMPNGARLLLSNNKVIKLSVFNTKIVREIKLPDGRVKYRTLYRYPQNWGIKTEWSHKAAVEAIELAAKQFEDQLAEPLKWAVIKQDHGIRIYEIRLTVEDAKDLLDLTTDFLTALSEKFEETRAKY